MRRYCQIWRREGFQNQKPGLVVSQMHNYLANEEDVSDHITARETDMSYCYSTVSVWEKEIEVKGMEMRMRS